MTAALVATAAAALIPGAAFAGAPSPSNTVSAHGVAGPRTTGSAKPLSRTPNTFSGKPAAAHHPLTAPKPSASGTTLYVASLGPGATCTAATDTGTGTSAKPFCLIQDAISAAKSGDVISIAPTTTLAPYDGFTLSGSSGLTIAGSGPGVLVSDTVEASKPGITFDGASNITLSNLEIYGSASTNVAISGSSHITLDADYVSTGIGVGVSIDGTSSAVTISRTSFDSQTDSPGDVAISAASGAADVTIASNLIAQYLGGSIEANGVDGLFVVGNTIQRDCGSALVIADSSLAAYVENNLIEDTNPVTDAGISNGGGEAACTSEGFGWAPDISVSTDSAANTTSDFNDFYVYGSDDTQEYDPAGGSGGTHDVTDTVEAKPIDAGPFSWSQKIDAALQSGSAAIGAVSHSAPGALSTDFFGNSPYGDDGAIVFADSHLSASFSGTRPSALSASLVSQSTATRGIVSYDFTWGDGTSDTVSAASAAKHVYAKPGVYIIGITITDPMGYTSGEGGEVVTLGSDYTAYGPVRLLDTRGGLGVSAAAPVAPGATVHLPVTKVGSTSGIPSDATAAVLNVTVTNTHGSGFITVYDDGDPNGVPSVSNVNYVGGQTVPNLTIVPIGEDGSIALTNGGGLAGNVDLIADVTGYFSPEAASGFTSLAPDRLVDTRSGVGAPKTQVQQNGTVKVQIAGADGGSLPAEGIAAVALNVTVTGTGGNGFLTAYPDGTTLPNASNVNYTQGQTIANSVVVPVASDGKIDITNSGGLAKGADIIVDVVGYYGTASPSAYVPMVPTRSLDTRAASWTHGPLENNNYDYIGFGLNAANGYTDDTTITAVVVNATVTDTKGNGFLTIAPDPNSYQGYVNHTAKTPTPPNSSILNWGKGTTVPNLAQAGTGQNGIVDFWNLGAGGGTTDLIVDMFGYYQAG